MDIAVHNLIHKLLVMSEEDPQVLHSVHLREGRLKHQELIQSVKEKIKPGLISEYTKAFEISIIKDYLHSI